MKIWFKEIFNAPNYFLFFLIILTIFSVSLNTRISNQRLVQEKQGDILILEQQKGFFNDLYWIVWYDNSVWKLIDKDFFYQTGSNYKIQGEFIPFKNNDQDDQSSFYLNTGIVGEIKITERLLKSTNCNFLCRFLKWSENLRYQTKLKFLNLSCIKYREFIYTLSPIVDCQNVAGLSIGLTMGGTKDFTKEAKDSFKKMGLMHLVAVSGLQVVLLISFVEWFLSKIKVAKKYRILAFLAFLLILLVLAGPMPPILRSSLSVILSLFSLNILKRKLSGLRNLIYTAIILLLINSNYIFSLSFLMSFLASLGLQRFNFNVYFEKYIKNRDKSLNLLNKVKIEKDRISVILERISLALLEILTNSIGAILYILPIIVNLAGFVSFSGIFTSLLIIPLIPVITVLDFLSLIPILGDYLFLLSIFLKTFLLIFIQDFSSKVILLNFTKFSDLEIFFYYIILFFLVEIFRRTSKQFFRENTFKY